MDARRTVTLPALNASFRRTLRAEDRSERTVKGSTEAVGLYERQVHSGDHKQLWGSSTAEYGRLLRADYPAPDSRPLCQGNSSTASHRSNLFRVGWAAQLDGWGAATRGRSRARLSPGTRPAGR
jgi:hypothetical protein